MQNEFLAYINDEESFSIVLSWAESQGLGAACVQQASLDLVSQILESSVPPKLLVVDIDNAIDIVEPLSQITSNAGPNTKIIAVGSKNDVDVYRQVVGAGGSDYLVKPLTREKLTQMMAKILRGEGGVGMKDAKLVVFIGARGGVGTSTIALGTAWISAHEEKKQTVFLDLDLHFGSSALALDLEPGRGLRDLVNSPQRVDSLMIASSIVAESDTLAVLCAEEGVDELIPVDGNAITALIKEMRPNYDYIFVDLPRHSLPLQKRLLAAAHEIVLVSEMSLIGIRDTLRIRTSLKSLACPARITLVVSPVGPLRPAQVDKETFEKGTQLKIDFIMPDDAKSVTTASNNGKSVLTVAPTSALAKKMRELYHHFGVEPVYEASKKGGWLSQFLPSKKDKKK